MNGNTKFIIPYYNATQGNTEFINLLYYKATHGNHKFIILKGLGLSRCLGPGQARVSSCVAVARHVHTCAIVHVFVGATSHPAYT